MNLTVQVPTLPQWTLEERCRVHEFLQTETSLPGSCDPTLTGWKTLSFTDGTPGYTEETRSTGITQWSPPDLGKPEGIYSPLSYTINGRYKREVQKGLAQGRERS